jgi:polyphosphate glucokinase
VIPAIQREMVVQNGIILRKFFLDRSQDEQRRRFDARIDNPVKQWKLSAMDIEAVRRWWDYTAAYQRMIAATHTREGPGTSSRRSSMWAETRSRSSPPGKSNIKRFPSGPTLTRRSMVSEVKELANDWMHDVVSIGYPGPVLRGRPVAEPYNLGRGWVGFNFASAFGCPVKVVNDAAMLGQLQRWQDALLGLGTGLGTAMIVEGMPMELGHLPYKEATYEDYVGRAGLERYGKKTWRRHVIGIEAVATHRVGRELSALGHDVKQVPPSYAKPFHQGRTT